jgi:8-oxo-dGTP pyrophosphatase MutT (NUDIX family)
VIVIVQRTKGIEKKWTPALTQLPKGGCREGESLEQTALREVREETGFKAKLLGEAGEANWSYERNGQIYDETVHYYFLEPTGPPQAHDDEFEVVRWIRIEEAAKTLSYPEERSLIARIIASGRYPPRTER